MTALDANASERWPRWTARARAAAIAATLAVAPPVTAEKRPTVMAFYSGRLNGFDRTSIETAQAFATR